MDGRAGSVKGGRKAKEGGVLRMSHRRLYGTKRWKQLRRAILDRDGWRCRECSRAGRLEVHHVRPTARGGRMWDPGNLRTLCRDCHFRLHREGSRSGRAEAWARGAL